MDAHHTVYGQPVKRQSILTGQTMPESLDKKLSEGSLAPVSFHARVQMAMRVRDSMTKEALEDRMGFSRGYVSRFLSEQREPQLKSALAFAQALAVRVEWLVNGTGPMDESAQVVGETYAMLDGWAGAAQAVIDERRGMPAFAVEAAGRKPVLVKPPQITPEFVRLVARLWLDFAPESERGAEEQADKDRVRAEEDAKNKP